MKTDERPETREERERRVLHPLARRARRDRLGDPPHHIVHLPIDHDGVEPLFAAEMLVHDGLRHLRPIGDLLDRRGLVSVLREHRAPDVDEHRLAVGRLNQNRITLPHVQKGDLQRLLPRRDRRNRRARIEIAARQHQPDHGALVVGEREDAHHRGARLQLAVDPDRRL